MQGPKPGVNSGIGANLGCEKCLPHSMFEATDMGAGQLGSLILITINDGPQQVEVLAHMVLQIRQPVQDHAPDAGSQIVIPDQNVFKVRVRGRGIDALVNTGVQSQGFNHGCRTDVKVFHCAHYFAEVFFGGCRSNACSPCSSQGFQLRPDLRYKGKVSYFHAGGKGPPPRICNDKPIQLQALQCFTHRRPANLQVPCELVIIEEVARFDVQHQQAIPEAFVRDVSQGFLRGLAGDCQSSKSHCAIPFFTTKKSIDLP